MLHTTLSPAPSYAGVRKSKARPILTLGALFFIFGFISWMNSALIPYFRIACELNQVESYLVSFSFYISYLLMAIPASWVLQVTGFKKGMALGLVVMALGALVFIPAALSRISSLFVTGLFLQGAGMTLLQTAAYPYIVLLGPVESGAKRIIMTGFCHRAAGAIAPIVLGAMALKDFDGLTNRLIQMDAIQRMAEINELASQVVMPYSCMIVVLVVMATLIYFTGLPELDTGQESKAVASANENKKSIFQFPHLLFGVLALFLYVGVEVIVGESVLTYSASHGLPLTKAKIFTAFTLLSIVVGYLAGMVCIPRYCTQQQALCTSAVLGLIFGLVAVFTNGNLSVLFIALLGLANSLMWPTLWPLSIAGLGRFTKVGSAFLVMGISGGAILPFIYRTLAITLVPQQAYWIFIPCYLCILFYSIKGYKLK